MQLHSHNYMIITNNLYFTGRKKKITTTYFSINMNREENSRVYFMNNQI